jgi:molybdenum cofactor guanylyltransferase
MGREKALLEIGGTPLIVRTAALLAGVASGPIIIGPASLFAPLGLAAVPDDFPESGPLGGIATALRVSTEEWNLVVACDLPYLTREWLDHLVECAMASECDAIVPTSERGAEPLCAMYRKRCDAAIRAALRRGIRKVTSGLTDLRVGEIEPADWKAFDSHGLLFKNMNSPAEYEEARLRLGGRAKS